MGIIKYFRALLAGKPRCEYIKVHKTPEFSEEVCGYPNGPMTENGVPTPCWAATRLGRCPLRKVE